MKLTNFFKLAVLSSILVFAVGCGKDNKTSNGYMNLNPIAPGQGNDIVSAEAVNGYNSLLQWRNQIAQNPQQERNLLGRGIGFSKGDFSSTGQNQTVPEGCEVLFKILGQPVYWCKNSGQTGSNTSTADKITLSKCTRTQMINNGQYQIFSAPAATISANGCTPSGGEAVYNIASNDELNQLLSGAKGKILRIYGTGLITIEVGPRTNYYTQPTHVYQIDTNVHSIYNPVASKEIATEKVNKLFQAF